MIADIELYNATPEEYDRVQNMRPDYRGAINTTVDLAAKYTQGKESIDLADFCGGTGMFTKKVADRVNVSTALIIDINQEFLKIAKASGMKVKNLRILHSDIIDAKLQKEFDLVLSVFAYHHVSDDRKERYLRNVLDGLKEGGILILTEIYLPNHTTIINYYDKLLAEIPDKNPALIKFLTETARSTNSEFKVSKEFADRQLSALSFKILETVKIWPLDDSFPQDVGTFVQILQV